MTERIIIRPLATDKLRWWLDVLDISHGLAISIGCGGKMLLYGVSAGWCEGDMGKTVILPYLIWRRNMFT